MSQQPDNKPGAYYVTVIREDGEWRPLVGPFLNDHAKALSMVEPARSKAQELDPRAWWYGFGTVRLDVSPEAAPQGILNRYFEKEIAA